MKIKFIILMTFIITFFACSIQPRTNIDKENQYAMVFLGAKNGNRIRILNFDRLLAFNIYYKNDDNELFTFADKVERPKLPQRFNFTAYGVEWVDPNTNSTDACYRIMALDEKGIEFIELKQIIALPDGKGGWQSIKTENN